MAPPRRATPRRSACATTTVVVTLLVVVALATVALHWASNNGRETKLESSSTKTSLAARPAAAAAAASATTGVAVTVNRHIPTSSAPTPTPTSPPTPTPPIPPPPIPPPPHTSRSRRSRLPFPPVNCSSATATSTSKPRRRIAYAITINKDGFFHDGAAVLAYSIFKVASRQCDFVISLVAFVHPNVTTSRPTLRKLGFHVIEAPKPINVSAINPAFTFLHKKMDKNGCCGALELIKLNSYRLTQYEWVIHMDADTFFLNPIDELLERPFSLIYTTDPNMATYKAEKSEPAQGGFLVLRPSVDDYKNIINVIMTTGFFEGSGWNRSAIGWFWGGMTVQGVLPFYYNAVTTPGRSQKVDRCIYNSMADTGACEKRTLDEIKSAHFTICQKPWNCYSDFVNPLCTKLHQRWFALRKEAEAFYGIKVVSRTCSGFGGRSYARMAIDSATFPADTVPYAPDDSPDVLLPIGNAGFRPDAPYEEYKYSVSIALFP